LHESPLVALLGSRAVARADEDAGASALACARRSGLRNELANCGYCEVDEAPEREQTLLPHMRGANTA
jgi:hypothetical protein